MGLNEVKMEFRPPAGPKAAQDVQNMLMRLKSGTVHRMDWGEASGNASGVGGDSIGEVDADGAVRVPLDTEALGAMPPEARSDFEADLAALGEGFSVMTEVTDSELVLRGDAAKIGEARAELPAMLEFYGVVASEQSSTKLDRTGHKATRGL